MTGGKEPDRGFGDRTWLHRRARAFLGARERREFDSNDVAHEVLIRASRYTDRTSSPAARRGLLDRILRNFLSSRARRRRVIGWEELPSALTRPERGPSALASIHEQDCNVREVLSVLSDRSRRVVQLRLFHEHSFASVGEQLGISEGNARVIFHRAIERLRPRMTSLDDDPER